MRKKRWLFLILILLMLVLGSTAAAAQPGVLVLKVQGPIVPVVADYIHRGIAQAEASGASALIIELDTPGGLVSSAQEIIQDMLAARVPVVVYVYPAGAWAGSAGAFITLAANVAAMAPSTFIGAAHPVTMGGGGQTQELPKTIEEKTVNALASSIKSIAEQRHRNVTEAEAMVRQSTAKTDREALELNLIDERAESLSELLDKLEGRKVTLPGEQEVTLHTRGAAIYTLEMNAIERILLTMSNPNIAYILLTIAILAIMAEVSNPGMIFPGVIGGIGLFTALYTLGTLEANYAGILLILLAFGLFMAEAFVTSHGVLAVGGVISLIMGSLLLFSGSPAFGIDLRLIIGIAAVLTAVFAFIITAVVRTQRRPQVTGREGMIGMSAEVRTPLEPAGTVLAHGELWRATVDEGAAAPGEEVIITEVQGLRLKVARKK